MPDNTTTALRRPTNIPPTLRPLPPLSVETAKKQPVVQAPTPAPVSPPPAPPAVDLVQPVVSTQQRSDELQEIQLVQAATYLSVGAQEQGYVEFDLMSHREKGNEIRYLNIQIQGFSLDESNRGKVSNNYMAITNREDFDKVKSFFSTLKWED